MITPVFTVDVGVSIRTSTNDPAANQLIFADQQVRVNVEENGAVWPIPAGATFDLVIVSREDPPGGLLAKSTSCGPVPSPTPTPTDDETGTLVFAITTNTVELRAHLAGARGKQCIVELVRTDLVVPQTLARWQVVCWNQGYDPVAAVYAELKHNTACNPDVAPTVNDDSLLGYAIGSVWVHCSANVVYLCVDATPGAAEWRRLTVAADEFYDNSGGILVADNVQDALDEVAGMSGGPHGLSDPAIHLSSLTPGQNMVVDSNGLPADGTNTDTAVAGAVAAAHVQGSDQGLDTGGTNAVTAAQAKAAYTHSGLVTGNPHAVTAAQVAALPLAGGTMAGEINLADNLLTRPYAKDVAEVVNALGSVSGNPVNIDLEAGNVVSATNGGALTFVFQNPPASGRCGTFVLVLTNGGAALVTWPGAVKWPGGTPPTLTVSGVDVLVFFTLDAGTTWRGAVVQADSK
jgi:hypothetical protein